MIGANFSIRMMVFEWPENAVRRRAKNADGTTRWRIYIARYRQCGVQLAHLGSTRMENVVPNQQESFATTNKVL